MRLYEEEEDLAATLEELILDVSDGALEIPSDAPGKYLLASIVLEEILKRGVLRGKDFPTPFDTDPDRDEIFHRLELSSTLAPQNHHLARCS